LVAVIVAVVAGGVILVPSLGVLFRLLLLGQLDHASAEGGMERPPGTPIDTRPALIGRLAAALLIAGFGFLNVERRAGLTRLAQRASWASSPRTSQRRFRSRVTAETTRRPPARQPIHSYPSGRCWSAEFRVRARERSRSAERLRSHIGRT
jgi:hypothetical protein